MKTTIATITIALAFALSACGGSDTTTTVQAPAPEPTTTTTAPEATDPSLPLGWTEAGLQDWLSVCTKSDTEAMCVCVAQELGNQGVTDADIYASPDPGREFRSETTDAVLACDTPSY